MKRVLVSLLLAAIFLCQIPFSVCAAPSVSAESAILLDARDADVLYEKNADTVLPMASTTKIMTALIVLEHADLSKVISIPRQACGIEGSSAYLYEGERLSVRDLLFALLLQSANDAAVALALSVCETVDDFVLLMNEYATRLGLVSTSFQNPHGLPAEGHASSARDLAKLMQYGLKNETFCAIIATENYTTKAYDGAPQHYFRNHNRLLTSYEHCIGGKTGFTKVAGRCLVSAAEYHGSKLICVTLSAPDDWNDHTALYKHGFSQYQTTLLAAPRAIEQTMTVVGGTAEVVTVTNLDQVTIALRNTDDVRCELELKPFAYAPICGLDTLSNDQAPSGAHVAGYAVFYDNERELCRIKLYYTSTVEAYVPPTVWERILTFFGWKKSESKNS